MIQENPRLTRVVNADWRAVEQPWLRSHYAALIRNLQMQRNGTSRLPFALGITACRSGDGASSVAANLAWNAVQTGSRRVLLVDANLERPELTRKFRMTKEPGLADCLSGGASLDECLLELESPASLSLLTAGLETRRSRVNHELFEPLVDDLRQQFDLIVVDLPVVDELSLCLPFSRLMDGVLLVIRAERVDGELAVRVKERLVQSHVPLLGAIFNEGK